MLDDLRQLRALQLAQAEALQAGDTERMSQLDAQRLEVQARIVPEEAPALAGADLAEVQALIRVIAQDQEELTQRAVEVREALGDELRGLTAGRAALAGYRPAGLGPLDAGRQKPLNRHGGAVWPRPTPPHKR